MRAVVLDFSGTLTTLPNPVAFIEALKAQGDYVVLWTASHDSDVEKAAPGTLAAVDVAVQKPELPLQALDGSGRVFDEVIVVDDEEILGRAALRFGRSRPEAWRYIHADEIQGLQQPR